MIDQNDIFDLMFRLRGGLARDMYGMQHEGLFSKSIIGTKELVENYHQTVVDALNCICDSNPGDDNIPQDAKLAFFNETRHSYGRTALLLSGGASLAFYHLGVVMELLEQKLLPRVISGVSAGSLVVAMIG
jgi:TAG lipase / steryl ester hydrolase / phospholipase A2 / LPA acyltransferase